MPFLAHKGKIAIMVFDDPACMAETTKEGNDFAANFNRTQIAKRIAGLVSRKLGDQRYQLQRGQSLQARDDAKAGECIVGANKPATAIAINFVSDGTGITRVEYGAVYGCGKPL